MKNIGIIIKLSEWLKKKQKDILHNKNGKCQYAENEWTEKLMQNVLQTSQLLSVGK